MRRLAGRLWPRSLSGRLALVLITGMLAAQALTGTIWYDMRYGKAMEIPTRLAATRLADAVRMLDAVPAASRPLMLAAIGSADFSLRTVDAPSAATPAIARNALFSSELFLDVLRRRLGSDGDELARHQVRVLSISLAHAPPRQASWFSLLHDAFPSGHFVVQLRLHDGQWLQAEAREGQAGMSTAPRAAAIDYLLRIYVLRIAAVLLLAWLAVRLVMQPLAKLAAAADKLGGNIFSAPLATDGPTEVRKASQAFNAMQRRLIDNIAERTRFLAAVSHDLRSPITRLKLRTELLAGEAERVKFRRDLDEMDALVGATLTMVQDSGLHEQQASVDIDSLLASLRSDFAETGAQVQIDGQAAPLPAYPRSLKRCLQNLIDNAIRYGHMAQVTVRDDARQLTIAVRDDGPGIPEELLTRALEPFYRVESSRNAGTGGFGLGLSIAQTVALAHHGELLLRNGAQGGLVATLILPRAPLPPA